MGADARIASGVGHMQKSAQNKLELGLLTVLTFVTVGLTDRQSFESFAAMKIGALMHDVLKNPCAD
jgi:hypothetical protein